MTRKRPLPPLDHRPTSTLSERPLAGAVEVPIEQLLPDPDQPRRPRDDAATQQGIDELAASIREFGVLQPLLVREDNNYTEQSPRYRIVAGARRHAAALRAGLSHVPVVVRATPAEDLRVLQLIENLQRQDLPPLDEARAYQELMDLEHLSPPGVADRLHISPDKVRHRLRLQADQVLADAVERRQVSASAAREITKLPDEEREEFRQRIKAGETLQSNDVAVARARLRAEGVTNPRIKRAPSAVVPAGTRDAAQDEKRPLAVFTPVTSQTPKAHTGERAVPPTVEDGRVGAVKKQGRLERAALPPPLATLQAALQSALDSAHATGRDDAAALLASFLQQWEGILRGWEID